jgi:hypothetical protein
MSADISHVMGYEQNILNELKIGSCIRWVGYWKSYIDDSKNYEVFDCFEFNDKLMIVLAFICKQHNLKYNIKYKIERVDFTYNILDEADVEGCFNIKIVDEEGKKREMKWTTTNKIIFRNSNVLMEDIVTDTFCIKMPEKKMIWFVLKPENFHTVIEEV